MNKNIWTVLKGLVFFGMGFGILYWIYLRQEAAFRSDPNTCPDPATCSLFTKIVHDFGTVHWGWMMGVLAVYMMSNLSRALRWNLLIEPLGKKPRTINTFLATVIGYMVNMAFPRAGEIAKPAAVARFEKLPLDKLIGTIVVDRAVDMLCFACVISLALLLEFDRIASFVQNNRGADSTGGSFFTSPLFIVAASAMLACLLVWVFLSKRIMATGLFKKIQQLARGFLEGILTVKKVKHKGWFVFHSINIWVMYYFMIYLCFNAYGPTAHLNATPIPALLVFVASSLGMLFPSPGGMGAYHYTITMALSQFYAVNTTDAFTFANILFIFVQGVNLVVGLFAYAVLPIINKELKIEN